MGMKTSLTLSLILMSNLALAIDIPILEEKKPLEQRLVYLDKETTVVFGAFEVEYFADRMGIKCSKVGLGHLFKKSEIVGKNKTYKAELGPFRSRSEAEEAFKKVKAIVPDLPDAEYVSK